MSARRHPRATLAIAALLVTATIPAAAGDVPAPARSMAPVREASARPPAPATPGQGPSPVVGDRLAAAMAFAPPAADVFFTDWAAMKAIHGFADVTSASPIDERFDALMLLSSEEAPMTGFGLARLRGHADAWGWDTTDLEWEAQVIGDGPPVSILRFREGFDLAPVAARFDERGFSSERHDDATIRSRELDLGADWVTTTDLGIHHTAFLDDGRTLVLSSSPDALVSALDARTIQTVAGFVAPPALLAADALGAPLSAAVDVGADACVAYDPRAFGQAAEATLALIDAVGPLRPWAAMAVGTHRDAGDTPGATGTFVFGYQRAADAEADRPGRERLLREGLSARAGVPYADGLLPWHDTRLDGAQLLLDVVPGDDRPAMIARSLLTRDLLFAMCG